MERLPELLFLRDVEYGLQFNQNNDVMLKEVAPDGSIQDRRSETCGANQSASGAKCIKLFKKNKKQ